MGLQITLDRNQFTEDEKATLFDMLKQQDIPMMTPETWRSTTGRSTEDLAAFVKQWCVVHDIRKFLTGTERLGKGPKFLVMETPAGHAFFLISLKPDYPERIH